MGTKKERIYGKRALFKGGHRDLWGAVAPNCPPGSATDQFFLRKMLGTRYGLAGTRFL